MPLYEYTCNDCEKRFEIRHSMSFDEQICIFCESVNLFRNSLFTIGNNTKDRETSVKIGSVVNEYIKDAKEDLKKEKKEIREKHL